MLLTYLLPLVLPAVLYFSWAVIARKYFGREAGPDRVADGPWFWLIAAGLALMIVGLVFIAYTGGDDPEGVYQAPYLEDGRVVPGQMKKSP